MRIRESDQADLAEIFAVVNEAAQAYRGVVPIDCWHEPYMPMSELEREIAQGIIFCVAEEEGHLLGVMGIQDKGAVALFRVFYDFSWETRGI